MGLFSTIVSRGAGCAALAALLLAAPAASLWAEDPPEKPAAPAAAAPDAVVYSEPTAIGELLAAVAKRHPGLVGYSPEEKQLQRRLPPGTYRLGGGEVVPMLRRMLAPYELTLVPQGAKATGTWWVMDVRQQATLMSLRPEAIELTEASLPRYEGEEGLFVTALIPTRGLDNLRDTRTALQRIITQQNIGSVTEVPDASAFIVTDFAPKVCAIYRLLRQIEANGTHGVTSAQSRLIQVQHGQATDLAMLLTQALGTPPAPPMVQQQQQQGMGLVPGTLRILADARTNQLLVRGTPAEIDEVGRLLQALDVPLPQPAPVEATVIRLRSARADRLANLLSNVAGNSAALWTGGRSRGVRPTFVGDERTNALIVTCAESALDSIRALVKALDQDDSAPAPR